jgi:hypothetical protein
MAALAAVTASLAAFFSSGVSYLPAAAIASAFFSGLGFGSFFYFYFWG